MWGKLNVIRPIERELAQQRFVALCTALQPVLEAILAAGGTPFVVGGAVRDAVLGLTASDVDIEVYGLPFADLRRAVAPLGAVQAVGASFGVLKLRIGRATYDLALPVRRTPAGAAEPDPWMSPDDAFARRDFTCNALGLTADARLVDRYGGVDDLARGVLRHTSAAFDDDPLRVLRGMQLAGRFDLVLAPETAERCQHLLARAADLPADRIWHEWRKWALYSTAADAGLWALYASGWHRLYPLLAPHDAAAWQHIAAQCEAVRQRCGNCTDEQRMAVLIAALCVACSASADAAQGFVAQIAGPHWLHRSVVALVGAGAPVDSPDPAAVRRLAVALAPASVRLWAALHGAAAGPWLSAAAAQGVLDAPPVPLVQGRDLIDAGWQAGPQLGPLLQASYHAQLAGTITTADEALAWLRSRPAEVD